MRFALVDDNGPELAALAEGVRTALARMGRNGAEIVTFSSGEALLDAWQPGMYDVIMLDIFMGDTDGVQVARRIRQTDAKVLLVFCTSSNDFAAESYEVAARYYLRKPVTAEALAAMLRRLEPEALERQRMVTLPGGRQVPLYGIRYTEYYNHVVTVYLSPGLGAEGDALRVRTSQAEMEDILLPCEDFLSPNRGIIVNLREVERMSREDMVLRDGKVVRIARRKCREVREAYTRFRFRRMQEEVSL